MVFGVRVPSSRDAKLAEEYGKDTNHSCVFELRHVTTAPTRGKRTHIECQFTVRTLLTRILPHCNLERSKFNVPRLGLETRLVYAFIQKFNVHNNINNLEFE